MNCTRASKLISDYVDGSLASSVLVEFDMHVSGCEKCAAELESTRTMVRGLAGLSSRDNGLDCWPAVRGAIVEQGSAGRNWLFLVTRPLAYAPVLALMVFIAIMAFISPRHDGGKGPGSAAVAEYRSYFGAHSQAQRYQPLSDPDVAVAMGELENANLTQVAWTK